MLIDISEVEAFNSDALDVLLELLSDPEEVIRETRMRFALIGVKPFAQRFLREVMPLEPVKHIRARFFHEVAEKEALAWLSAMVDSAGDLPEAKTGSSDDSPDTKKEEKEPTPAAKKLPSTPPVKTKPQAETKTQKPPPQKTRLLGRKKPDKDTSS
jgi:hypothetical protein